MFNFFSKPAIKFFAIFFLLAGFLLSQNEARAAVTYFSSASNPVDSATATLATTPVAVTPPASMTAGDLVIMVASTLTTGITPAISATGGQTWTAQTANTANASQRIFWATYNGTWSANPSVSFSTSVNTTVAMHVFRPTSSANTWAIDVAQTNTTFASPAAPRDVTITGITTNTNGALVFATWATGDDNTWGLQTAGWANAGTAQYRNVANSDSSQSSAYKIIATAGASGNVTNRQLTLGGDNGNSSILVFKEVDATSPTPNPMTFGAVPTNDSAVQISMTSTTGVDATPPVNYLFTNNNSPCGANAGTGGTTSSWQSATTYSDSGLQANKCYGYTVTARDSVSPTPNTGTASAISSTYTSANTPGTPTLGGATANSLNLTNAENSNPASNPTTNFAVQVVTTSPSDASWLNKWVNTSGNPSASAVWMTDAQLDALVLHSLQSSTLYGVKVKARNQDTDETALSAEGQGTTSTPSASGTVSSATTTCTILSGGSTCTIPFTWNILNATSPNLYNATIPTTYSTSASGSSVAKAITNGTNTVQVRDDTTVLNSISVTGICTAGTAWNGSICSAVTFAISASSGANGAVTPTGITNVAQGSSQVYAISPNSGYTVATLVVDSISIATSTSYTFTNVQATHTISATFIALPLPTFTITANAETHGAISPTGTTTVTQGNSLAYTLIPDAGFAVATLTIDASTIATTTTSYTFTNVQANHTIAVAFALIPITHTITSSAGSNGSIAPLGATIVADDASQEYTLTPDNGFTIETLVVDSVSIATSTSYTFSNVTTNHTISATFALIPPPPGSFTIIATSGEHGAVLPSGSTVVTQGTSQAYTITPDTGYDVATLIIDSFPVATSTAFAFTNVQTAHTIEATFSALPSEAPTSRRRLASITFSGKAFPGGKVSIVQKELDTEKIANQQDITGVDGSFQIRFVDLPDGVHSFGLLVKDPAGRTSQTKFFLVDAKNGDETYKNIVFPPTVDILGGQVSRGSNAKVFGYASPGHTIRIYLDDILSKEALAGNGGAYSFELPTGALPFGQHKVRAKQINLDGGRESDFSTTKTFIVSKLAAVKSDLNGDGKIDIKDLSIFLARFSSRDKEMLKSVDLNSDGKVDISDFSIFIKTIKKK